MLLGTQVVEGGFILVAVAGVAILNWHRRKVARWARVRVNHSRQHTFIADYRALWGDTAAGSSLVRNEKGRCPSSDGSFVLITVAHRDPRCPSGRFANIRSHSLRGRLPMNRHGRNGSRKYGIPAASNRCWNHSSKLPTQSKAVAGRISVRFCPFQEEYLDPFALKAIVDKVSRLATALENEAVRAGVPKARD